MAGERIGKTYEALLYVAFCRLKKNQVINHNIYWNVTPTGVSVEPDFLIGADENHPELVFMVTHSASSRQPHMKAWRNLGELCELKTVIKPSPKIISIYFDSNMGDNLKALLASIFDSQLIIGDTEYGREAIRWVQDNESALPQQQLEKAAVLERMHDPVLERILSYITEDLKTCILNSDRKATEIWEIETSRKRGTAPVAKKTFVRRGLSKLLVFEDIDLAIRLYREGLDPREVPSFLFSVGFAQKTIAGARGKDYEIQQAVNMLDDNTIKTLYHSMDGNEVISSWRKQLKGVDNLVLMSQFIIDNFESICDPDWLSERLISLHSNPNAIPCSNADTWPPANVWLFDLLMEFIKASTHKANGYGHAQLAVDISRSDDLLEKYDTETLEFLLSPWGHLSAWATRSTGESIPDDVIKCVGYILSNKAKEIGIREITKLSDTIAQSVIHNIIEAKLCTYFIFTPLKTLLISKSIITPNDVVSIRTCFAEKARITGQAGKTTVAHVKRTIINWQTATDAGKDHKRKELCGRAVGLRYTWDSSSERFVPRPNVAKLILLLDGTWTQKDLNMLIAAGWDEIYYPDEIDSIRASIV